MTLEALESILNVVSSQKVCSTICIDLLFYNSIDYSAFKQEVNDAAITFTHAEIQGHTSCSDIFSMNFRGFLLHVFNLKNVEVQNTGFDLKFH